MSENRPFFTQLTLVVKTYDIDFANIVHNMVYIRWLEDLRFEMLTKHYSMEEMLADGFSPILTRTEIEYRRAVRLGDVVNGRMWLSELGQTKWTVQAELIVGDKICTTANQNGYFANLKTLRPARVPEKFRQVWEGRLVIHQTIAI
jgi:acyl-CoA thioester hydrolase